MNLAETSHTDNAKGSTFRKEIIKNEMKRGAYTVRQINLLRAELNAVYSRAKKELGHKVVSWLAIAVWIEEAFEKLTDQERKSIPKQYRHIKTINLSNTDNFRKFSVGQAQTMETVKLIAIDIWLTEKNNHWSQLTTDKLRGLHDYSKIAASLEHFLFENNAVVPALNTANFLGKYTGIYGVDSVQGNTTTQLDLMIQESTNPHVVTANVVENRTTKKIHLTAQTESMSAPVLKSNFSGWIVLSPEDNIVCYLKNINTGDNHIYYLIAINESVFDGAQADCLAFLDRQIPSEISNAQKSSDYSTYLIDWAEENQSHLMIFHRQRLP